MKNRGRAALTPNRSPRTDTHSPQSCPSGITIPTGGLTHTQTLGALVRVTTHTEACNLLISLLATKWSLSDHLTWCFSIFLNPPGDRAPTHRSKTNEFLRIILLLGHVPHVPGLWPARGPRAPSTSPSTASGTKHGLSGTYQMSRKHQEMRNDPMVSIKRVTRHIQVSRA